MNEENRIEKLMDPGTTLQVNVVVQDGKVQIVFNKPVVSLTLSPQQSLGMSAALIQQATIAQWGQGPPQQVPPPE